MKIPNQGEFQQIIFIHSLDTGYGNLKNLYKNCTAKRNSFLEVDITLPSDNPLRFRKNILGRI